MTSPEDILLRSSHGDRDAFALLYERYASKCAGFIGSLLKDSEEAVDITQDIFIKLWINRSQLLFVRSFDAYLMHMAKNAVLDRCDRIRVTRKFAENFRVTFDEVSEETARRYEADEFLRRVQKAVSWMPPARRKVFLLSRFYGMDNKSIASLCKLSVRTVETHLFHATQYLRKKLLP